MASKCISNCVNNARAPVRATYINLYKWPESDAEFIRSVSSKMQGKNNNNGHGHGHHPKVVDSISCRQLYLRSYTFSREEENVNDEKKAVKCYGKRKTKLARGDGGGGGSSSGGRRRTRRKCKGFRKAKEISCSALASIFRRLLSCTTKVDVVG
ncbi:uncharacterized protein LOC107810737 [Nicotiana tabacum]|uniref:Uncharacterized protein LOC107810737 n=1 Tax=Nicotiana tabacum TaxID=4097 RepID=A0A1S4BQ64_TOBAC|nr:uncharacterized protein LOC104114489 [Nicotiana tomentosiformis]XP_016491032.1 PREDICTED: uncharacterized protein LOC107810737 [Nicotiana tabacum]